MNHLAHFLLAPTDDAGRAGTLLGDFIRGPDLSAWPTGVEQAIRLHRRIDAFTDTHPVLIEARGALPRNLRRYAGILMDVYFDHLLIAQWAQWASVPLSDFADEVHDALARLAPTLPHPADQVAGRMAAYKGLMASATHEGMVRMLARIGNRLSRPVALDQALPTLLAAHATMDLAFSRFFPALQAEAAAYRAASTLRTRPSALSVSR